METPVSKKSRIEEILDLEKMTNDQRRILWIARLSWAFVAMEIIVISFTLPLFAKIFALNEIQLGILAAGVLIGDIIGAFIMGRLSDIKGRRSLFQISLLWYSIFTILTATANNFEMLLAFRILAGIGLGGMLVVDPTLLSEFLPKSKRGNLMVSLDLFWPIGSLLALALSFIFLEAMGGNWRALFYSLGFPALMIAIFRLYVPESPFYLAKTGRLGMAVDVLRRITGINIKSENIEFAIREEGSYKELFSSYGKRVAAMLFAWCALNYTYYGLFLWLPGIINAVNLYGNVWIFLVLAFVFQIPGYLSAMFLVELLGRKKTLFIYLISSGIFGITLALTTNDVILFTLSLITVSFFNLGAWGSVYPFTSELFPTKLRGKAFGLAEGIGKIVAVLGPVIFGALYALFGSVIQPIIFTMIIAIIGALAILILAPETKKLIFD